jgi:hypothetical protein
MRFYTKSHLCYGGIDMPTRRMSGGILKQAGASMLHRHMNARPEALRKALAPAREDVGGAVARTLHLGVAGRPVPP